MMTRKDYVATAEILNELLGEVTQDSFNAVADAVEAFAEMFAKDNERFNKDIFFKACNLVILEG